VTITEAARAAAAGHAALPEATMRASLVSVAMMAALAGSVLPQSAAAQDKYPSRPITLIVPFPAGGGVDAMGRIVAEKLGAALGQQVVIDNRGGAAGVIGTRLAARAAPDGYTLVMSTSGTTLINPSLYANPGYDPLKDFAPIGLVASTPIVVMAHPSAPGRTIADLIALARREPGKIDIGTPPPGTENYMAAVLFKATAGVDLTIVPYKGTGPLTADLLGGHSTRCRRRSATSRRGSCGRWRPPPGPASPSCPRCRRSPNPGCPGSNRWSITGCWLPPARRRTS
jgi:tripartite-type tricarboxylate transporter receptor subunit TctC